VKPGVERLFVHNNSVNRAVLRGVPAAVFLAGRHFLADYTSEIPVHLKARRTGIRAKTTAYAGTSINRDLHGHLP